MADALMEFETLSSDQLDELWRVASRDIRLSRLPSQALVLWIQSKALQLVGLRKRPDQHTLPIERWGQS